MIVVIIFYYYYSLFNFLFIIPVLMQIRHVFTRLSVLFVSLLLVSSILIPSLTPIVAQTLPFPDVSQEMDTYTAIEYLFLQNLLRGNEDGTFKPLDKLNRAEWAVVLVRLAGANPSLEDYNNCFPDVKEEWFAAAVCLAKELGWIKGYQAGDLAGLYAPARQVMDIEVLVTLARLLAWDVIEGGDWFEPALRYAQEHGIYDDTSPIKDIVREIIAEVIFRMLIVVVLKQDQYNQAHDSVLKQMNLYDLVDIDLGYQ